jgi:hypothetical protein
MTIEDLIESKIEESNSLADLTLILKNLLTYHSLDENERLYSIRALVEYLDGIKIEIYSNEHPPPHFHIKANEIDAVFSLIDCELLKGNIGGREHKMIKWWYGK